ncbi:MAG: extracellular solute-binding protein [Promicromonosporaceae bacterium]|nr:extracellular solute-binding protein [Promicromonosporaceae bacterium]
MRSLLGAAAIGAALLVSACGGGYRAMLPGSSSSMASISDDDDPFRVDRIADPCADVSGEVDFRWWGGHIRGALQEETIAVFEARYPNISVRAQPAPLDGYWDKLQIEATAGNLPDVFVVNEAWLAALISGGVLADLAGGSAVDLTGFDDDALFSAVRGGSVYAVPAGGKAPVVLVNLDILAEAGVVVPDDTAWTWADFLEVSALVSAAGLANGHGERVYGLSTFGAVAEARFWAHQSDGGMFDPSGELRWSESSVREFLGLARDLVDSAATPVANLQQELATVGPAESLMAQGRSAFQFAWSNQVIGVTEFTDGINIGVLRLPNISNSDGGYWVTPTMFFAQSNSASSPAAAACFLDFLVNSPDAALVMGVDRGVPLNSELRAIVVPELEGDSAVVAHFMDEILNSNNSQPDYLPELNDDLGRMIAVQVESVLFGLTTPGAAAASLHSNLRDSIS